ncbi:sialidase family protein [Lacticaseibacillus suihuaensis]
MQVQVLEHEHIFAPHPAGQCHASTVAVLAPGVIGAAWFGGSEEGHADVAIWFATLQDHQWSEPRKVADAPVACWNPVLLAEDGLVTLFYKRGAEIPTWQTLVIQSSDGGATWSEPRELVAGDHGGRGPVKNKCLRLQSGDLLAPASTEAGEWNCFVDRFDGTTWQRSANVPLDRFRLQGTGIIQPTLWQSADGTVHMLMRSSEGYVFRSDSKDDGRTWAQAYALDVPNNNCGIDVARLADGTLVLAHNPVSGNWAARTPMILATSTDDGRHFDPLLWLDHVPADKNIVAAEFSYPAIVASGQDVYVTYTWKRATIAFWHLRIAATL